ncbi:methyltransferase domain-containing protein [Qipengyuania sp. YG27]|uniref:Methyltransferase domain-containing protein n=1 Tax=Qipengyuania mesophila TaxID=2867246 RepID=A0ABS7JXD5_9SPHN|nr:methyltransferase domain-containing protein [Qipengyuania mesophila]MBX7502320.1 methyltransferase domain-containing protein [Qipengyuania mesophila]
MRKLLAAFAARLGLSRRATIVDPLQRKLDRMGLSQAAFDALAAMGVSEFLATLRQVAKGKDTRFAALLGPSEGTGEAAVAVGAAPEDAGYAFQRLISEQLVQFLLMQKLVRLSRGELADVVRIEGLDRLAGSGGVMLVGSHFGPARLVPPILAIMGVELTAIAPIDFQDLLAIEHPQGLRMLELTQSSDLRILAEAQRDLRRGRVVHSTGDGLRGGAKQTFSFLGAPRDFTTSYAFLALSAGVPCHPVFIRSDGEGQLALEIEHALGGDIEGGASAADTAALARDYVTRLEHRWRSDFGNVPLRSLQLMRNGWQKPNAPAPARKGLLGRLVPIRKPPSRRDRWNARWARRDYAPFWLSAGVPAPLVGAVADGHFRPGMRLLEVGCGQGENAFFAAQQGLDVVAVDFAEAAIRRAREKHGQSGLLLDYRVADITRPHAVEGSFDCAFDCGCLHAMPGSERDAYARNLAVLLEEGATFLLLHKLEPGQSREGLEADLRRLFGAAFAMIEAGDADLGHAGHPQPAIALLLRRGAA